MAREGGLYLQSSSGSPQASMGSFLEPTAPQNPSFFPCPSHDYKGMLHKYQGRRLSQKLNLIISLVWESVSTLAELTRLSLKKRWWQVLPMLWQAVVTRSAILMNLRNFAKGPRSSSRVRNLNTYSLQTAFAEYLLWARHFYHWLYA